MQLSDLAANDDSRKPQWFLMTPTGHVAHRVLTHSTCGAALDSVNEDGTVANWHHDDFPDFECGTMINQVHVSDPNGGDWLVQHCRPVLCPWDFSAWDHDDDPAVEPWPEEIVDACAKAEHVAWALHSVEMMSNALPQRYRDTTLTVAIDRLVKGRLEDELKQHIATIDAFRKNRVEVTVLPEQEPKPCATCAASIETRCMPCDECGHLDEEDADA